MIEDIKNNDQLRFKWTRLIDNAKFKSSNVGRASPIPTAVIRADNVKSAVELRKEIGFGKVKRHGAQAKLTLGPDTLRSLIPIIKDNLQSSYKEIEIISEWLDKLYDNTRFDTDEVQILANRRRILELKDQLLDLNMNREQPFGSEPQLKDMVDILRAELAGYTAIPEPKRSPFIKVQVRKLLEKIAEVDPSGNEAKILEKMEIEEYGK